MKDVFLFLDNLEIPYQVHHHPAVFTVEEADALHQNIDAAHTKNLFLRNKNKSQYYLVVVASHKRVDLKRLQNRLQESRLSFGSPDKMKAMLGLTPGSVSPFGLINDQHTSLKIVIDEELLAAEKVGFHPNINTATVVLATQDFLKCLNELGYQPLRISLP